MHPYTRYYPFTGTGSSTAADIITINRRSSAVNLVPNPSMEVAVTSGDASGYVVSGATIVRSNAQTASGTYSLLVDPANSVAGEGFYWTLPSSGYSNDAQWIVAQCEHYGASANSAVKLEIRNAAGTTVLATSGSDNLATSWRRLTASYGIPSHSTDASYRIYVTTQTNHNIDFYVDKFMVEIREDSNLVNTYVDGAVGIGYEWDGAINASASRRKSGFSNIRGLKIMNDTGSNPIYVAFDCVATTTNGIKVNGGETLDTSHPLYFDKNVSVLAPSGSPAFHGVVWGSHY
jgi:hypothetical protein